MGDFRAGKTAVVLVAYFFVLFIIMVNVSSAAYEYEVDNPATYEDTGFGNAAVDDDLNSSVSSSADEQNYFSVLEVMRFAIGFNNSINFGLPAEYNWMLRFILIWLPGAYLLICLYFLAPFLH